jgi:hypothetical protein
MNDLASNGAPLGAPVNFPESLTTIGFQGDFPDLAGSWHALRNP